MVLFLESRWLPWRLPTSLQSLQEELFFSQEVSGSTGKSINISFEIEYTGTRNVRQPLHTPWLDSLLGLRAEGEQQVWRMIAFITSQREKVQEKIHHYGKYLEKETVSRWPGLLLCLLVSLHHWTQHLLRVNVLIGNAYNIYAKEAFSPAPYLKLYDGCICKIVVSLHSEGLLH